MLGCDVDISILDESKPRGKLTLPLYRLSVQIEDGTQRGREIPSKSKVFKFKLAILSACTLMSIRVRPQDNPHLCVILQSLSRLRPCAVCKGLVCV